MSNFAPKHILCPVLILKALGWLLTACFTPYSRAVVAQMWPNSLPIHESSQGPPGRQRIAGFRLVVMIASVGGINYNLFKRKVTNVPGAHAIDSR